jgi:hypothetical protein
MVDPGWRLDRIGSRRLLEVSHPRPRYRRHALPPNYVPGVVRELTTSVDVYSGGGGVAEAGGIHVDAEVRGYSEFDAKGLGSFQFGYVRGQINYRIGERDGKPSVEFCWDGYDEMDQTQGRGWLSREGEKLKGMFFIVWVRPPIVAVSSIRLPRCLTRAMGADLGCMAMCWSQLLGQALTGKSSLRQQGRGRSS